MGSNERQRIAVLEKALTLLEIFDQAHPELKLEEIVKLSGLNKSSCQRIVHTLFKLGYLQRVGKRGTYSLSHRFLNFSFSYMRFNQLLQVASPYLGKLAEKTGLRVDLTILDGLEIVYVARIPSRVETFPISPVGRRWVALSSASGRAILGQLPEDKVTEILEKTNLRKATSKTILDKSEIYKHVLQARTEGFSYQLGEVLEGAASIAAPIFGANGAPIAAINIGTSVSELENSERRSELLQELLPVTQNLSNMAISP